MADDWDILEIQLTNPPNVQFLWTITLKDGSKKAATQEEIVKWLRAKGEHVDQKISYRQFELFAKNSLVSCG